MMLFPDSFDPMEYQRAKELFIPEHLKDSLIGSPIEGTSFYRTLEGDPTESGYFELENGKRIYKTYHKPTGSSTTYRKINSLMFGDCWEIVPKEGE